jgi:hypothetical protein
MSNLWRARLSNLRRVPVRILWRVLTFDIAAPLAAIGGLLMVGVVLGWPLWWVSACSILVLLVVEGVLVNFVLLRRDSVTVGTDDDRPGLRLVVVALCTAALASALAVGYTHWKEPDRALTRDSAEVVRIATEVAEVTGSVSPGDPMASVDRAAQMVAPDRVDAFKKKFGPSATDLATHNVTAQASTLAAGVEAIGPSMARVAVVLRSTQSIWDQPPKIAVVTARVTLANQSGHWMVIDISPIHPR